MIYYQLYNAGLINQLMSIELAVGIQSIVNKPMYVYNVGNGRDGNEPIFSANKKINKRKFVNNNNFFTIDQVLDWNTKDSFMFDKKSEVAISPLCTFVENLMFYYFDFLPEEDADFSENRIRIKFLDNMNIKNTLGWYSRFFNNRPKEFDKLLGSVKFLPEYYELSETIAKSLGNFNGLHLRLTDHIPQRVSTTTEMFDAGISKINDGHTLVLCSDDPDSDVVRKSKYNFVILDEYILDNFGKDFAGFRYTDEVSFGILNNLVMHHSRKFVGTIGSTYSSYIQRSMNQKRDIDWLWFDYINKPVYKESFVGKYSWNGSLGIDTHAKQWHREWKESRLA